MDSPTRNSSSWSASARSWAPTRSGDSSPTCWSRSSASAGELALAWPGLRSARDHPRRPARGLHRPGGEDASPADVRLPPPLASYSGRGAPPTPELRAAADGDGLDGRVAVVDSGEPFSFVYGVLVPRVAISRGFLESLTAEELRAALEHERYHVRNLDPLRALIGKVLTEAFFLLPSLEVLRARYQPARELAADRRAEQACGGRPLLGALLKALEGPEAEPVVSASLAEPGLLDARISRLETGRMPALAVASSSSLAWSALGASAFLFVFVSAMIGLGGTSALARAAAYELSATRHLPRRIVRRARRRRGLGLSATGAAGRRTLVAWGVAYEAPGLVAAAARPASPGRRQHGRGSSSARWSRCSAGASATATSSPSRSSSSAPASTSPIPRRSARC